MSKTWIFFGGNGEGSCQFMLCCFPVYPEAEQIVLNIKENDKKPVLKKDGLELLISLQL